MPGEHVFAFSDGNFKEEVIGAAEPVLVDFWAAWCGPCKMIAPVIDEIAEEFHGKVKVGKVDVDENRQTAMEYGVMSIPTLIIFKGGQPVERAVGYKSKDELKAMLEKL
ncbi:MAG: thioredoxin [Clostridia bacterium]|nr:thioredoxin [Clostridia bacterium]